MRKCLTSLILAAGVAIPLGWSSLAEAYSSRNTPEYAAEREAATKVPRGYSVRDANMRSTRKSISIVTANARGKQVNFECLVRRQDYRNGTYRYFVGTPQVSGSGH